MQNFIDEDRDNKDSRRENPNTNRDLITNIIIPTNEEITWCSPLVVQPKPKFTDNKENLEPHMIRASIDMRIPNESMKRSRCVQAPKVDDFEYHYHDCKAFSKLDLKQGYHQLTLDQQSRQIATFSTPWSNFRPGTAEQR